MAEDIVNLYNHIPSVAVWEKDIHSVYQAGNLIFTQWCGFKKPEDVFQISDYDIPCRMSEAAETWQKNDRIVSLAKKVIQFFEILICSGGELKLALTTKIPKYNEQNGVIGTYGHAQDITQLLSQLGNLLVRKEKRNRSLSHYSYIIDQDPSFHLTSRQSECLFLILRGKTSKEIAKILNISPRTVEDHTEAMKIKFNCKTKNELIDTTLHHGLMNIIPKNFLNDQLSIIIA